MSDGTTLIANERQRQIDVEGWTPEHDNQHAAGDLVDAAGYYTANALGVAPIHDWPWDATWWKPTTPIRDLTKAGALLLAEADRCERLHDPDTARRVRYAAADTAALIDDLLAEGTTT